MLRVAVVHPLLLGLGSRSAAMLRSKRKPRRPPAAWLVSLLVVAPLQAQGADAFHPTNLPGLELFIESTHGLQIARCASLDCFDAGENAPLAEQYCDTETFPDGCLRRWQDQSSYRPDRPFEPPEWTAGRDFGQDDHDKPGVVLDCLNGKPCVRGGRGAVQERSLETEPNQEVGPVNGPFSIFLLARPVAQGTDFVYFGFAGTELTHLHQSNALKLRIHFKRPTVVTPPDSVTPGNWYLIEVHRRADQRVRVLVNGWDRTLGSPTLPGEMYFRFLFSVSRGRAMHGDIAAAAVYGSQLQRRQIQQVREYLAGVYGLSLGDGSPLPDEGGSVDLDDRLLLHWPLNQPCGDGETIGLAHDAVPDCEHGPTVVDGVHGRALRFDRAPHGLRSRGGHPRLDQLFRFSAAAWIRAPSTGKASTWRAIIDKRDSLEDGWDLYLSPDRKAFLRIDHLVLEGVQDLADGHWHHVAGVYDGDQMRLYVDGRLEAGRPVKSKVSLGTDGPLWVGRKFNDGSSPFLGTVDEVRVYGRALSAPEIQRLAKRPTP